MPGPATPTPLGHRTVYGQPADSAQSPTGARYGRAAPVLILGAHPGGCGTELHHVTGHQVATTAVLVRR